MKPSIFVGKTGSRVLRLVLLLGVGLMATSCWISSSEVLVPCEPRSNTDPGRLNIAVVPPNDLGVLSPCEASLDLYIAQNTPLRSLDGRIELSTTDGEVRSVEAVSVDLKRTDYGMLIAQVDSGTVADQNCRSLRASLDIQHCRGAGGELVDCPEIRVKPLPRFADFSVSGENLSICYDD
jgi:hypothetical protein